MNVLRCCSRIVRPLVLGSILTFINFRPPTYLLEQKQDQIRPQWIRFDSKLESKDTDLIILVAPDRFQPHFAEELYSILEQVQKLQQMKTKRKLEIRIIDGPLTEEVKEKYRKLNIFIDDDTLILLKNKYISSFYNFTAQDYFENRMLLVSYFKKINKINHKNRDQFKRILSYLPAKETAILIYADKNSPQYKNICTRFVILQQAEAYSKNDKLHWLMIDRETAEELKINPKDGQMFFLQKSSKYNNHKHSLELMNNKILISPAGSLTGRKVEDVMDDLSNSFNKVNVFSARSFNIKSKYSVVLELDLNKVPKHEERRLIKAFAEFKEVADKNIDFVLLNKTPRENQSGYCIYIRDDEQYAKKLQAHSATDIKIINELNLSDKPHSYQYRIPEDAPITKQTLLDHLERVKQGNAEEYFNSQDVPKYKKYSRKLVGKNFGEEVFQNTSDYAVFQYSKHCHACGEYGQHFENLALDAIRQNSNMQFGRLNNDYNKPLKIKDFPYTPVFMVCKNPIKTLPYVYHYNMFFAEYGSPIYLFQYKLEYLFLFLYILYVIFTCAFETYPAQNRITDYISLDPRPIYTIYWGPTFIYLMLSVMAISNFLSANRFYVYVYGIVVYLWHLVYFILFWTIPTLLLPPSLSAMRNSAAYYWTELVLNIIMIILQCGNSQATMHYPSVVQDYTEKVNRDIAQYFAVEIVEPEQIISPEQIQSNLIHRPESIAQTPNSNQNRISSR